MLKNHYLVVHRLMKNGRMEMVDEMQNKACFNGLPTS